MDEQHENYTGKYIICKMCMGRGYIFDRTYPKQPVKFLCPQCDGTGEVDWIDEILGKNKDFSFKKS